MNKHTETSSPLNYHGIRVSQIFSLLIEVLSVFWSLHWAALA